MIYAYDQYLPLPVKDIYDTQMMLATVNAAKDMYEKGQKEMEDFNKKFGDFYSPIRSDMEWYDKHVTGNVRDTINQLYANGIDPLRSPEGRMLISRLINNMPVGTINQMKQSAAAAEEYLKNRGKLEAAGMYNPAFEDFMSNGDTLENWDTTQNGMWLRTSPYEFKTLKEITEPWFNNRTPHELTKAEVESFGPGYKYDPRYKYTGFTNDDLINVAHENTPGWQGSPYAKYYRDIARRQVIARGETPTDEAIERQLQQNVANAQQEYLVKPTSRADEFALQRQKTADDMRVASIRYSGGNGSGGRGLNSSLLNPYSVAEKVKQIGVASILGINAAEYGPEALSKLRDHQMAFGQSVSDSMKKKNVNSHSSNAYNAFQKEYGRAAYSQDIVLGLCGIREKDELDSRMYVLPNEFKHRLKSHREVVSTTAGFRNDAAHTYYGNIDRADIILVEPTTRAYQAIRKNNRFETDFEYNVKAYKKVPRVKNGKQEEDDKGNPIYDRKMLFEQKMYFDPNLKSVPNAPGFGSLDGPAGLPLVDTYDRTFDDMVQHDTETTKKHIIDLTNSYYNDPTVTELQNWPYQTER